MTTYQVKKLHVWEQLPLLNRPRWLAVMAAEVICSAAPGGTMFIPLEEQQFTVLRDLMEAGTAVSITVGVAVAEPVQAPFPPAGERLVGAATVNGVV